MFLFQHECTKGTNCSIKFNHNSTLCLMELYLCQKSHVRKNLHTELQTHHICKCLLCESVNRFMFLQVKAPVYPAHWSLCTAKTSAHSPLYLCSKLRHREPLQYSVAHTQILGLTNSFSHGQKMAVNKSLNIIY